MVEAYSLVIGKGEGIAYTISLRNPRPPPCLPLVNRHLRFDYAIATGSLAVIRIKTWNLSNLRVFLRLFSFLSSLLSSAPSICSFTRHHEATHLSVDARAYYLLPWPSRHRRRPILPKQPCRCGSRCDSCGCYSRLSSCSGGCKLS